MLNINKLMKIFKSEFRMKITILSETNNEDNKALKVIKDKWIKEKRKNFINDYMEELKENSAPPAIEVVYDTPEKFKFGVIYVLANGRVAWTYIKEEDNG